MTRLATAVAALGLVVALTGCGSPVQRSAVESAQQAITAQCGGPGPTDAGALAAAVATLERNHAKDPTGAFRFAGGQADTTMRAQVRQAVDTLLACEPALARSLAARTGEPIG